MAHHKSAKKRIKTNEKKRINNQAALSKIRTLVKKVHSETDKAQAEVTLKEAVSFLDKAVGKGRMHKNTAARRKSSLTKYVNGLSKA
ncbi:MAG: 30S ribosomal protein S20 [Bacteroidetes bacterium]|nr:30S ribosomal protein S20 [Bacteroidota bacterium]MBU2508600.1 30S ribosomal protein S20 [Bacteroidota bacterium]